MYAELILFPFLPPTKPSHTSSSKVIKFCFMCPVHSGYTYQVIYIYMYVSFQNQTSYLSPLFLDSSPKERPCPSLCCSVNWSVCPPLPEWDGHKLKKPFSDKLLNMRAVTLKRPTKLCCCCKRELHCHVTVVQR